jgi:predicted DsbA family dithiol-disulfide isomerase
MDPKMVDAAQTRLKRVGAGVGIHFKFGGYIGSSRLAHQLLYMAARQSSELQCTVSELLFHYQFEKEADISQLDTVVEVGVQARLREEDVREWLAGDVGVTELGDEAKKARADGVKGVPHFVIGGRYHLEGAVDISELFEAFVKVREGN